MRLANAGLLGALILLGAPAFAQNDTQWLVAPYVWLSDVTLDQSAGASGSISASDLLDKSDAVGMIRVEMARETWGLTFDYLFLAVSDGRSIDLGPPFNGTFSLRAELDTTIFEAGWFYRLELDEGKFDLLVGPRRISTERTFLLTPPNGPTQRFDGDTDVTDVFVGARYLHRFNNKWDLTLRGDYSTGDSEGAVNLLGSVGYRFNDLFALNLGYRHFDVELEDSASGAVETTDISLSGPILGFLFRF